MPRPKAECGTYPAYRRHLRNGEEVDVDCRAAQLRYAEEQRSARVIDGPDLALDILASQPLGPRGVAYRDSMLVDGGDVPAAVEQLVIEGARMADRLEHMNDLIAGKGVPELLHFRMSEAMDADGVVRIDLKIDGLMSETRQLQAAFERITKTLMSDFDMQSQRGGVDPLDAFLSGSSPNVVGIGSAPSRKQA